jgi:biotin synthase
MQKQEIISWLKTNEPEKLVELWQQADEARAANVGEQVHLRGLIEISNYCARKCAYCGINTANQKIERYRMTEDEIMECVAKAVKFGYGTVVMQAGEDYGLTTEFISNIIRRIKSATELAVTLSLGERPYADLKTWRRAGADRYLLRFETSDQELYNRIHPPLLESDSNRNRLMILNELRGLGYEVGSGIMIGIPGQTYASLAEDILLFAKLDLDMIGVGPYIKNPDFDLPEYMDKEQQVPNTELMTYKVIALTRLVCPQANIPSTTALASLNKVNGRELGLMRGANIVMPNLTPPKYRIKYEIYPNKACINETAEECQQCLAERIAIIGREIGTGKGGRF